MRRTYLIPVLLATAALSSIPAPAQASVAWQDCRASGGSSLQGRYTIAELNRALRTMPAYVEEYSNCASVIEAQINRQELAAHSGNNGSGTGTKTSNTPRAGHHTSDPKAHVAADNSSGGSMVLIVVIVVVALAGMILAFWASRRRRGGSPPSDGPPAASA